MKIFKTLLMGTLAVAALASCASENAMLVSPAPFEECVYLGDRTEFAVWAPTAEAAQLRLYHSASDEAAFKIVNMKYSRKDGLWKATVKEDVKGASSEPDVENGKTVYEIEFNHGGYEYEYKIDAITGEILHTEKERD